MGSWVGRKSMGGWGGRKKYGELGREKKVWGVGSWVQAMFKRQVSSMKGYGCK
jgi:hypothetical protein